MARLSNVHTYIEFYVRLRIKLRPVEGMSMFLHNYADREWEDFHFTTVWDVKQVVFQLKL